MNTMASYGPLLNLQMVEVVYTGELCIGGQLQTGAPFHCLEGPWPEPALYYSQWFQHSRNILMFLKLQIIFHLDCVPSL